MNPFIVFFVLALVVLIIKKLMIDRKKYYKSLSIFIFLVLALLVKADASPLETTENQNEAVLYIYGELKDYGEFNILSLDRGINWYAFDQEEVGGIKIIGLAEEKFPGLLKVIKTVENSGYCIKRKGPINLPIERRIKTFKLAELEPPLSE